MPLLTYAIVIIAGGKSNAEGHNPFLPGDDESVVRVTETFLPGVNDFLLVDATHMGLVSNLQTIHATIKSQNRGTSAN